ncbi:unnamed protein product [Amoebophrya sp. A120]|nr:unnamed protein product [Amoebophrya sp. A120]|eukprot:GSA120T00005892001.1
MGIREKKKPSVVFKVRVADPFEVGSKSTRIFPTVAHPHKNLHSELFLLFGPRDQQELARSERELRKSPSAPIADRHGRKSLALRDASGAAELRKQLHGDGRFAEGLCVVARPVAGGRPGRRQARPRALDRTSDPRLRVSRLRGTAPLIVSSPSRHWRAV